MFNAILDKHAPMKTKFIKNKKAPFMNSELRKAIFKKRMFFNKFRNSKRPITWNKYKAQRNLCTRLRKKSINSYFALKCAGGVQNKDFWPTIKPFLNNKAPSRNSNITLQENEEIINEPESVSRILNDYFIHMGSNNRTRTGQCRNNSIAAIYFHSTSNEPFEFQPVTEQDVYKQIKKMNTRKATGCDQIPAKIIKLTAPIIARPLSVLINKSLSCNLFPDGLKLAEVVPVYKKKYVRRITGQLAYYRASQHFLRVS